MRALLICVVAVSVAGCTFGVKTCSDTSECGTGATCQQGFCVAIGGETGGGNGGGTATGGGAAQGGGAATGGGDGTGGGTTEVCPTLNCTEACVEPTGCVPYFTGIEIVSPDAGARVQEGLLVPFVAQMVVTAGVTVTDDKLPTVLTYTDEDGGVGTWFKIANENRYRVNRTFSACGQDTMFTTMASLEDGGFPVAASVVCDGQAPTVTLPTMNDYFQRDDVKLLQLTASEPLSTATATLGGVALELADAGCTDAGPCFVMDFSKPNFPYIDAGVQLTVTAVDEVGLSATIAPVSIPVTRVRWTKDIGPKYRFIAAPAVSPEGWIVVCNSNANTGTAGECYRLDSITGEGGDAGMGIPFGAVQGVAISRAASAENSPADATLAFVSFNAEVTGSPKGRLSAFNVVTMTPSASEAEANGTQKTLVAPALVRTNGDQVAAVSASNGVELGSFSRLLHFDSANGGNLSINAPGRDDLVQNALEPPMNAVVLEATTGNAFAHFVREGLVYSGLIRVSGVRSAPQIGTASTLDGGGASSQIPIGSESLISSVTFAGSDPHLVRIAPGGTAKSWDFGSSVAKGAVALESSNQGYVGSGTSIVRFDPSTNGAAATTMHTVTGQTFALTPVLLSSGPSSQSAWGYAVSNAGVLAAFDRDGSSLPWSGSLRTGQTVRAHPGFGCNTRPGSAPGTGVVYVAWADGVVQAIVVDGARLRGAWPKYQRSMGNAGNDDADPAGLFPTNWANCPQ